MTRKPLSPRLAGHTLPHEGRIYGGYGIGYVNRQGRTRCSCGQESPDLPNTASRKRWHRDHKTSIRRGEAEA